MKKVITVFLTIIMVLLSVVIISPLALQTANAEAVNFNAIETVQPQLKVGFIYSLSGDFQNYSQSARNGFDLALEQADYKAGGYIIDPIYQDDKNDITQAESATNSLISQGVSAIVGSIGSNITVPISNIANSNNVVLITGTASSPEVTVADNERKSYVFRTCFIDAYESLAAADFINKDLKKNTAAIVYQQDDFYYCLMANSIKNAFASAGGQILYFGSIFSESMDSDVLSELEVLNPDIIILECSYPQANAVSSQIRAAGINSVFIGNSFWLWESTFDADTALNEAYITNCYANDDPRSEVQEFKEAYNIKYGSDPDSPAALFYDATKLLLNAVDAANSNDPTAIRDILQNTKNFSGVSGDISYYTSSGNPYKPVIIEQIQNGDMVYITSKLGEEEDLIPPELTEVTTESVTVGTEINATSNEDGYIYLVPADTTATAVAVQAAGEGDKGKKAAATLDTNVCISTEGLEVGFYRVYAIDTAGNLSAGSDSINICDNGSPETWKDWANTKQKSSKEFWIVEFNKSVDFSSVSTDNIYVATDEEGIDKVNDISLESVTNNPCIVTVGPPPDGWQSGQTYYLFISNGIKSLGNEGYNLKEGVRMEFTVNWEEVDEVKITVKGTAISNGYIIDGTSYAPCRDLLEALEITYTVDTSLPAVLIPPVAIDIPAVDDEDSIQIVTGSTIIQGRVFNGTTYVPIRQLSEALGFNMFWDSSNSSILID